MKRRHFLKLLGGVGLGTVSARAQTERVRQVGVLMSYLESEQEAQDWVKMFVRALEARGWRDGANLKLHYRWRGARPEILAANAAELAALNVDAILAGATPAALALKNAAPTTPVVFANVAVRRDNQDENPATIILAPRPPNCHPDCRCVPIQIVALHCRSRWSGTCH
jgi:ABC-type uncharacterized transport system substrate-binding protein